MARPEKFKPEYVAIAKKACDLGATDMDLAEMFGVSLRTISYWRSGKPEFAEALRVGKDEADKRVEQALFNRAMGYSHEDTDVRVIDGQVVMTPMVKHYPPDTTAAIFWLKNRKPVEWRDKVQQEISGPDGGAIQSVMDVSGLPTEVLEMLMSAKNAADRS